MLCLSVFLLLSCLNAKKNRFQVCKAHQRHLVEYSTPDRDLSLAWSDITEWLQGDQDVYWITAKPISKFCVKKKGGGDPSLSIKAIKLHAVLPKVHQVQTEWGSPYREALTQRQEA